MMKKTVAFLLAVLLLTFTAFPALAAGEDLSDRLARVTQTVKETLGIDDSYTEFNGQLTDDGAPAPGSCTGRATRSP